MPRVAAGSLYGDGGSEFPNAFQWIELLSIERCIRVHFRLWQRNEWIVDRNLSKSSEPYVDFDLGGRTQDGPTQEASGAPKIPPEYLDWLQRRYADVALLGQDIKQGHALHAQPCLRAGAHHRTRRAEPGDGGTSARRPDERPPVPLLQRLNRESRSTSPPRPGRQVDLLPLGGLAEHPEHPDVASGPGPGGVPRSRCRRRCERRLPLLVPLREFARAWTAAAGGSSGTGAIWSRRWPPGSMVRRHRALAVRCSCDHLAAGSAFLLLDGLDEVAVSEARDGTTVYPRALLLSGLADALPAGRRPAIACCSPAAPTVWTRPGSSASA